MIQLEPNRSKMKSISTSNFLDYIIRCWERIAFLIYLNWILEFTAKTLGLFDFRQILNTDCCNFRADNNVTFAMAIISFLFHVFVFSVNWSHFFLVMHALHTPPDQTIELISALLTIWHFAVYFYFWRVYACDASQLSHCVPIGHTSSCLWIEHKFDVFQLSQPHRFSWHWCSTTDATPSILSELNNL